MSDAAARERDGLRDYLEARRAQLIEAPLAAAGAGASFEAAARAAREVATDCLPLGIATVMHLYPLCALRAVPLPRWSLANLKRARLLRSIRSHALVLANAGSERAAGHNDLVRVTPAADGVRIDGTFEYVSLASVADLVLFSAPLAGRDVGVFCAADLRGTKAGPRKFDGSMQLSDTRSVTFIDHPVPHDRCLIVPDGAAQQCIANYQRCWFHLLLAEAYLARVVRLHARWNLAHPADEMIDLNELSCLRDYSLRLLDESGLGQIDGLLRASAAIKLRVSRLAQSTARSLNELVATRPAEAASLRADASELAYIRLQPTADEKILRSLELARPPWTLNPGGLPVS
jgi:hypothetical protein